MEAKDLKINSIIEIEVNFSSEEMNKKTQVSVNRVTDKYIWFKYNSLQRIGRNTIDKFPSLYKIISI